VIGWVAIVGGGMMALSGGMGGLAWAMIQLSGGPIPAAPAGAPKVVQALAVVFRNFGVLVAAQVLFAAFVAFAGSQLLRRRAWARPALEGVCWLGLLWVLGFGGFWIVSWLQLTGASEREASFASAGFAVFGAVLGGMATAALAAVALVLIRVLRSKGVREALAAGGNQGSVSGP